MREEYERWCRYASADPDIVEELKEMAGNPAAIEDAFYQNLAFGTGGLRGVIGAGTNRMNLYTVAKASQGLANYIHQKYKKSGSIAISYDSRIKSEKFAKTAARVFSANGIHVFIYPELMPTPCLSFAVRELQCVAGVMVTASHNPAKYNGYKVYGEDGCQITTKAAEEILAEIEKIDIFASGNIKGLASDDLESEKEPDFGQGGIELISEEVITAFVECVKRESLWQPSSDRAKEQKNRNVSIVYSPLHGTGLKTILRTLRESGYTNITVVKEQEKPDGMFSTCPYPNPEIREAMELGISYARKCHADLFLATDPDCDRVGIAVRNTVEATLEQNSEDFVLLSGNETGILLLDYICSRHQQMGTMPEHPVMIKTIVTIDMAERIAAHYGVETIQVLTGFKYIGEQIGLLEKQGRESDYIFGFEESYGYLSGTYVRDKDAVNASFLICEMFAYYKSKGVSLLEKLQEIYETYGYYRNTLHSYEFEGAAGFAKMKKIMEKFREGVSSFAGKKVRQCLDYGTGLNGLPKSDVLKFMLEDDCSFVVRPSGTEPKLKIYLSICAKNRKMAEALEKEMLEDVMLFLT